MHDWVNSEENTGRISRWQVWVEMGRVLYDVVKSYSGAKDPFASGSRLD